jgi:hypothetical protein
MEGVMEWYTMKSNVMGRIKWKWNYCDCQVEQKKITNHSCSCLLNKKSLDGYIICTLLKTTKIREKAIRYGRKIRGD